MRGEQLRARLKNSAALITAVVVIGIIIWLDISTGVWNDLVILSGLAAGLVTFLLTVMVLDRVVARSTARRWAPVNRLALSEFLHAIADEEQSEISRGVIVARELELVDASLEAAETVADALHQLRLQVVLERERLADVLSRWAQFLASSGDNEAILRHLAELAWQLDCVRDAALDAEHTQNAEALSQVNDRIAKCNASMVELERELQHRLATETRKRISR